jgi:hypothetical protein
MVAMAVSGIAIYLLRLRRLPMLNQAVGLIVASVVVTPFSSDYTLVHQLLPFGLPCFYAVDTWRRGLVISGLNTSFGWLTIVMGYEALFNTYLPFHGMVGSLVLVMLGIILLRYAIPLEYLDVAPSSEEPISLDWQMSPQGNPA